MTWFQISWFIKEFIVRKLFCEDKVLLSSLFFWKRKMRNATFKDKIPNKRESFLAASTHSLCRKLGGKGKGFELTLKEEEWQLPPRQKRISHI